MSNAIKLHSEKVINDFTKSLNDVLIIISISKNHDEKASKAIMHSLSILGNLSLERYFEIAIRSDLSNVLQLIEKGNFSSAARDIKEIKNNVQENWEYTQCK